MTEYPCKIFVAAWTESWGMAVFIECEFAGEEISMSSPMLEDFMPGHKPPSDGLWMFEGVTSHTTENDPEGVEISFNGTWRRPTEVELAAAACGENPCLTPCGV
jgi:hypothetical protein